MGLFDDDQDKGGYQQIKDSLDKTCKCSMKTRIIGWLACGILGWVLSIIATIIFIFKHDRVMYAVLYSVGQIINISGSCFLSGPIKQAKDMFHQKRLLITLCYLGSMILTLVLAFILPQNLSALVILTLIIQVICYYLYTLSYIPFGRKILKKACQCLLT